MNLLKTTSIVALSTVSAWSSAGHLLVARIAYDILEKESPSTVTKVESVLKILKDSQPSWTEKEGAHPFVECTTYADDIKYKGGSYQSSWHFVNDPYLDQGGKVSDFSFKAPPHNSTEAVNSIVDWYNGASGFKSSPIY